MKTASNLVNNTFNLVAKKNYGVVDYGKDIYGDVKTLFGFGRISNDSIHNFYQFMKGQGRKHMRYYYKNHGKGPRYLDPFASESEI